MVGSEGTLGFISQVTFETVHDAPLKATAMIYFARLRDVCEAILPLRSCEVSAAELMDRNALRAVENQEGMPDELKSLPENAAALLIDTSADDEETLLKQIREIEEKLSSVHTLAPIKFTSDVHLTIRIGKYETDFLHRSGCASRSHRMHHRRCGFGADVLGDALTDVRQLLVDSVIPMP
jgi:D-lactate dehydrogenase